MTFGVEKLEGAASQWWKSLKICLFISTEFTSVTDTQADRHHMTARPRLHSIAWKKWNYHT